MEQAILHIILINRWLPVTKKCPIEVGLGMTLT